MLKQYTLMYLLAFAFISCFAQKEKSVYLNADSIHITEKEYKLADKLKFYEKTIKTDTLIINKLKSRRAYGFLDEKNKALVYSILEELSGNSINPNAILYIHNFKDNKKALKKAKKNNCYWNYVKRYPLKYTSFLLLNKSVKKHDRVFIDEKALIQKLFFSYSEFEVNHVKINKSGAFVIYYGTYDICYILDSEV